MSNDATRAAGSSAPVCSEHPGFEDWWKETMQGRMQGSKYLARNAWAAALVWSGYFGEQNARVPNAGGEGRGASPRTSPPHG